MLLAHPTRAAVSFGVLATLLGIAGAWNPSLWTDEVATLNAVSKPWPVLLETHRHLDAVHAAYYALVKPFTDLAGVGPVTLRLPSAIAAGVVVAVTVRLTWVLADRRTALLAGVLIATMPVVLGGAIEARSPMFVTAAAATACALLVIALERRGWWWVAYGAALVVTAAFSLVALSLAAAHAVTVLGTSSSRRAWKGWTASVLGACAVIAPLAVASAQQSAQISWIPPLTPVRFAGTYAAAAWFGESVVVGLLVWAAIALALVGSGRATTPPGLVRLAVPWLLVPGVCLAIVTVVATPVFVPRYLAFCAPAAAMLGAAGLARLQPLPRVALLGAIVVACAVVGVQQRGDLGPESTDWKTASARIATLAEPGDAVVFHPDGGEPRSPRRALEAYPAGFAGLRDVGFVSAADSSDDLWGTGRPLDESAATLRAEDRSWALVARGRVEDSPDVARALFARDGLDARLAWAGPTTFLFALTPAD